MPTSWETTVKVYNALLIHYAENEYFPSYRKIGEMTEIKSISTVEHHMNKLFRLGWLQGNRSLNKAYRLNRPTEKGLTPAQLSELIKRGESV